ncbi:MAG TPA: hypothetical protein VN538_01510 [Clostridia bacterium]|nr:hypothetical protein [Clostridia bacterium]
MNEKKSKEYVRKRLHQVDPLFVRSEQEAIALAAQCRVSARTLIMRAQAGSALPAENWSGFYDALDAADRRALGDWRQSLRDMMRSFRRHGRLALGSLILALALAFFTLVPAGRAIAERIFNYVITVLDKQLEIDQADEKALYDARGYDVPEVLTEEQLAAYGYDEDGNPIIMTEPEYFDSVAAFETKYGLDAFELVSDQLKCVEVYEYDHIVSGKTLRTNYLTADQLQVNVIEQWYKGDGSTINFRGDIEQRTVLDGRTMEYAIDSANGSFDGFVLLENSILWIYADKGVDLDLIWSLLE